MRHRGDHFLAFSEYDCHALIESQKKALADSIRSQNDDYILNVNRAEYLEHLVAEYSIAPIEIHQDQLSVSTYEAQIPAEEFPSSFNVYGGKSYPKDVFKYHLPFEGDPQLLRVRASTYTMSPPRMIVDGGCICFEITNFGLDAAQIKQHAESTIKSIVDHNQYLVDDLNSFNGQIGALAAQSFDARKQQLLDKNDLIASLGVPIKQAGNPSGTFAVPAKRTKVITAKSKPDVSEKGFKPEPALEVSIYNDILKIMHDVGKEFERLPSTYGNKEEEHLRDHFLLMLEPNFEGSATGETFNKSGKTDILLRHDSSNVFIAELKFWSGQKAYLETIDQLLGYLTWRDSKAAVVMFVRNKEISPLLEAVVENTPNHPNYIGLVEEVDEGWYSYRFHINDDPSREVKLAVMLFHIPG